MVSMYQANDPPRSQPDEERRHRVAWTKGGANREVAELLGDGIVRITGDLDATCVDNRIEILVTKRFPRSDVVPTVVPVEFDADTVTSLAVAVGDGPHSARAVSIGETVANALGIPGTVITAYRTSAELESAEERLTRLTDARSGFETMAIQTPNPRTITEHLSKETLLVHGAAGGSFIDRHFTGTGNRLTSRALGSVLVVKDAPQRCFQITVDPTGLALAPELLVSDALQVMSHPFAPVVTNHQLLGIVRIRTLVRANPRATIEQHVEACHGIGICDPVQAASAQRERFGPGPLPVVDDAGNLVGVIPS
ncbi:MAG: hypothetical protein BMS9Abin20_0009 [Acidimicrobiia bacterium]|nr:MAG: hypothetical protein BMS9Abin20_0009 [Acidimicrobiia bacterium]